MSAVFEVDLESDPPISAYAAVAESLGLPALWSMLIPGTTRDMFEEDAAKIKRLVKMVGDYLDCPDTERSHIEDMAAGLAKINRKRMADERMAVLGSKCEELAHE